MCSWWSKEATGSYAFGATEHQWGASTASDFGQFRLHRGASRSFPAAPANLIAATTGLSYSDPGPAGRFYELTAVDINGNESLVAVLGPDQTVDVGSPAAPLSLAIQGIHPNPATDGRLVLRFSLPSDRPATIELMDAAGRRMATRKLASPAPGRHSMQLGDDARLTPELYWAG